LSSVPATGTVAITDAAGNAYSIDRDQTLADAPRFLHNIENFIGVAQVPVGIAGPLLVDGEHARGTFYVPLATTEGALVASYNRGMKLLYAAGGVRTTVVAEAMQRAPAFGFDSAREARAFGDWLTVSFEDIKAEAEPAPTSAACTTSSSSRPAGTCSCGSTTGGTHLAWTARPH
jgi:hydroxymethylglutaryl-CoA reductase